MRLKRIDHIGVVVDDPDTAARLLEGELGLAVDREAKREDMELRFLACGDASIELIWVTDPEERRARLDGGGTRIEHIAIEVEDLDAAVTGLAALGVELTGPPQESGGIRSVWTRPQTSAGIMLQFMQRPAA